MSRINFILDTLLSKGEVSFHPKGNSMTPKIKSGVLVKVKVIPIDSFRVGDVVYAKVKGNYYLHLLTAIDIQNQKYQISNNNGYVNGWIGSNCMYGVCVEADGKVFLSEKDLESRK